MCICICICIYKTIRKLFSPARRIKKHFVFDEHEKLFENQTMLFNMNHLQTFFCQINQAVQTRTSRIDARYHYVLKRVVQILYQEGRIRGYKHVQDRLFVWLKYHHDTCVIQRVQMASRPSVRIHAQVEAVPVRSRGLSLVLVSTNLGICSLREAQARNVGGLVLCWVD